MNSTPSPCTIYRISIEQSRGCDVLSINSISISTRKVNLLRPEHHPRPVGMCLCIGMQHSFMSLKTDKRYNEGLGGWLRGPETLDEVPRMNARPRMNGLKPPSTCPILSPADRSRHPVIQLKTVYADCSINSSLAFLIGQKQISAQIFFLDTNDIGHLAGLDRAG